MRIKQGVTFVAESETVTGEEIQRRVSLNADEIWVRGSRTNEPLRPRSHAWRIGCDERGLRLDEQIARLVERLRPAHAALEELSRDPQIEIALSVFRDFDADDGQDDDAEETAGEMVRLDGQHQLLGWHLDAEMIAFLASLACSFDFDEYG